MRLRRVGEDDVPYLVDRVSGRVFALAAGLLVLTLIDGLFTMALLECGCEEANPAMRLLLRSGPTAFFAGKYLLMAVFLPVALVMNRYRLFGTRMRVGHVLPVLAVLYLALIVYQVGLWRRAPAAGVATPEGAGPLAPGGKS